MTDTQIFTIAVAIVIPVVAILLGNSRVTDVRNSVQHSIQETKETLRADVKTLDVKVDSLRNELLAEISGLRGIMTSVMGKLDEIERRR